MKLSWITLFISSSLLLHTATAIPGLRYFRSSIDNVNRYRIRDTVPEVERPSEDVNDSPPNETGNVSPVGRVLNRLKLQRPIEAMQGLVRPEKLRRTKPTNEDLLAANNVDAHDDNPAYTSDIPPLPITEADTPQPSPTKADLETIKPPTVALNPPSRQPAYTDEEDDEPAPIYPEPMLTDQGQDQQQNQISPSALSRLRQFANLNSVLANIARIPRQIALQIDSVMAGLQSTYPTNTNVGAYMMGTRFLLRNQMALRPFELMDRAGLGRFDEMVSTMPSLFNPVINSMERFLAEIVRRITAAFQRVGEYARRVSDRTRSTLSGMNVARDNDSYLVSVPNLIDLVLKGRLASALDGYLGLLQRGIVSSLSGIGNSFSPSAPVIDPVRNDRNQGYQMKSNPGFSAMGDYYKPSRY